MNTALTNFQGHQIRTVEIDGARWYVAKDVCGVLGLADHVSMLRKLADHEKGEHRMPTLGGKQRMACISRAGAYKLAMRSDKPEAVAFQDWLAYEVIPQVEQTGAYLSPAAEQAQQQAMAQMAASIAQVAQLVGASVHQFNAQLAGVNDEVAEVREQASALERKVAQLEDKTNRLALTEAEREALFKLKERITARVNFLVRISKHRTGYLPGQWNTPKKAWGNLHAYIGHVGLFGMDETADLNTCRIAMSYLDYITRQLGYESSDPMLETRF